MIDTPFDDAIEFARREVREKEEDCAESRGNLRGLLKARELFIEFVGQGAGDGSGTDVAARTGKRASDSTSRPYESPIDKVERIIRQYGYYSPPIGERLHKAVHESTMFPKYPRANATPTPTDVAKAKGMAT